MNDFKKYMTGECGSVEQGELSSVINQWKWFITPRAILSAISGKKDSRLALHELFHSIEPASTFCDEIKRAYGENIIDRFLDSGNYKIDTDADAKDIEESAGFDNDDGSEFLTEDLAEIYLKQGFFEQAKEIYRQLSLLYPKKSIYFAEIIEQIEKEKENKQLK